MGWARTLLLGDVGNRLDIADTENDIRKLRRTVRQKVRMDATQDERIERLEKDVGELELCLSALSKLFLTRGVLTPSEVQHLADLIDGADGDGAES